VAGDQVTKKRANRSVESQEPRQSSKAILIHPATRLPFRFPAIEELELSFSSSPGSEVIPSLLYTMKISGILGRCVPARRLSFASAADGQGSGEAATGTSVERFCNRFCRDSSGWLSSSLACYGDIGQKRCSAGRNEGASEKLAKRIAHPVHRRVFWILDLDPVVAAATVV
jgi:hypothetical protein